MKEIYVILNKKSHKVARGVTIDAPFFWGKLIAADHLKRHEDKYYIKAIPVELFNDFLKSIETDANTP